MIGRRYGPAALLALAVFLAVLFGLLMLGAPAPSEVADVGPPEQPVDVLLQPEARVLAATFNAGASIALEAEELLSYCVEDAKTGAERATVARDYAERARCESGRRPSGVVRRGCAGDLERFDWIRLQGTTPPPLRC